MSTGWLINTTEQSDRAMVKRMFNFDVPPHCVSIFINTQAKAYVYTVELPPHMRHVIYKHKTGWGISEQVEHYISLPRTILTSVVRYNNSYRHYEHIGACMHRIKEPYAVNRGKTKLFHLPICNVAYSRETPNMCIGSLRMESKRDSWDAADKAFTHALNGTIWTESITGRYDLGGLSGMKDWHDKSAIDPDFGEKLPLVSHPGGFTAAKMIFSTLDRLSDFWSYADPV